MNSQLSSFKAVGCFALLVLLLAGCQKRTVEYATTPELSEETIGGRVEYSIEFDPNHSPAIEKGAPPRLMRR